ncbi:MAG: zinc ribbon domain-containing protein [Chthoniobacterales bacterium]
MPIYEYEILEGDCKICGGEFELRRPLDRPELVACPRCQKPVRRVISRTNTPCVTKPLSVSDAKASGFTVYKKRDKGTYEKL